MHKVSVPDTVVTLFLSVRDNNSFRAEYQELTRPKCVEQTTMEGLRG